MPPYALRTDLVNQLEAERREGRTGHLATRLLCQDPSVLDELGYLPLSPDGGALLVHLISKLYARVSLTWPARRCTAY